MGLTLKQEKFINKYLECGNASEAYRHAYDCSRMKEATLNKRASELLKNGEIAGRLEYLKAHLAEASGISALRIIREHEKIAFSDATRVRDGWMSLKDFERLTPDERACIKSVETKTRRLSSLEGGMVLEEQVKITTYDKQKSLDSITEMLGYKAPVKTEQEVRVIGSRPVIVFGDTEDRDGE